MISRLLYKLKTLGIENIPAQGPFIFAGNHSSKLDTFLIIYLLNELRSNVYIYGGGGPLWSPRSINAVRGIPILRGVRRSGPSLWMALKILQKGYPILIAPEGAISWDGQLQPFQPGAAWLALRSEVPIVPCVLRGGYSIWPRWAKFPRLRGRLEIRIGEPFTLPKAADCKIDEAMIQVANQKIATEMAKLERGL